MKCDICNKEMFETNQNTLIVNGEKKYVCGKHYAQYRKFGKFTDVSAKTVFDLNDFKKEGKCAKIYTRHKNGDISGFFIIDIEDLDRVIVRKWRLWNGRFFTGVHKPLSISHYIMGKPEKGFVIDHINHNPADNRKSNLRIVNQSENTKNTSLRNTNNSGIAGIWFDQGRDKWAVEIKCNYIKCFLGRYDEIEDACFVRYVAEKIAFGEFRNTSNDFKLIPLAEKSKNKKYLEQYTKTKISNTLLKAD